VLTSGKGNVRYSPYRWYISSVSFSVLGALLYVFCHVKTLSQGERIVSLRQEREDLIRKSELLQVQAAGLQRASRIREIAAIELGMRFPDERPNNIYTGPSRQNLTGSVASSSAFAVSDAGR
jgi:cell division protein FtsL